MLTIQIIQASIDELAAITKVELCVVDMGGGVIASTFDREAVDLESVAAFADSPADSQVVSDYHYFKVRDEEDISYILLTCGNGEEAYTVGRIAVSQLQALIKAYKEKYDCNNFFQNLILDNMLLVDIYNHAKKLKISSTERRVVFVAEIEGDKDVTAIELLRGIFSAKNGDYVTSVSENCLIIVKELSAGEDYPELERMASTIVDMLNSEAMVKARVTCGTIVSDLKDVSRSYKEAQMAMDVGKIFYSDKNVVAYNTLGIGRLIYQLPTSLCELFMNEIFGGGIPEDIDEETLITINKFFENNLNVSETSRQLYVHRNTLVYRIEKLQKSTGLDIRVFDDALTLKIALMVVSYMKYLKESEK